MSVKAVLQDLVNEAYDRTSWHGPNLRGSLRGLKPHEVEWRPARGRHTIRELTIHAAYWKFRIRRRLSGDMGLTFPLPGNNWFEADPARSWTKDLELLANEHRQLVAVLAAVPERRLLRPILPNGMSAAYLVRGIAAHDLYHAGQISMLKRMVRSR